jgi:elongation factor Ts
VLSEKIRNQNFEKLEGALDLHPPGNKNRNISILSARVEGAEEASRNVAMQAAAMFHPLDEAGVDAANRKEIEIAKDLLSRR